MYISELADDKIKVELQELVTPLQRSLLNGFGDNYETKLLKDFKERYKQVLRQDHYKSVCAFFPPISRLNLEHLTLEKIFHHALYNGGHRTYSVLQDLEWINKDGKPSLFIPFIQHAMEQAQIKELELNQPVLR